MSAKALSTRGYYSRYQNLIVANNHHTATHEYAHHLQRGVPELDKVFQSVHKQRTRGDKLEALRTVTSITKYAWSEVARKDGYYDPYVGREYSNDPDAPAQEVLTMSFDKLLGKVDKGSTRQSVRRAEHDTKLFFDFIRIDQPLFDTALGLLFTYKP